MVNILLFYKYPVTIIPYQFEHPCTFISISSLFWFQITYILTFYRVVKLCCPGCFFIKIVYVCWEQQKKLKWTLYITDTDSKYYKGE